MPARWSAETEVALLMAMLETANVKPITDDFWAGVSEKLGEDFTSRSVMHHFTVMKNKRADMGLLHTAASYLKVNTPKVAPIVSLKVSRKRKATDDAPTKGTPPDKKATTIDKVEITNKVEMTSKFETADKAEEVEVEKMDEKAEDIKGPVDRRPSGASLPYGSEYKTFQGEYPEIEDAFWL